MIGEEEEEEATGGEELFKFLVEGELAGNEAAVADVQANTILPSDKLQSPVGNFPQRPGRLGGG